jgi:hypothetical protein
MNKGPSIVVHVCNSSHKVGGNGKIEAEVRLRKKKWSVMVLAFLPCQAEVGESQS